MMSKPPKYLYILAMISGVFVFIIASMIGKVFITVPVIFLFVSGIFGFF